jgi:amidase, hydantoinase/carbamoylase family
MKLNVSKDGARYEREAATIMQQCDKLATFSATPGKIDRRYLTPEHARCNRQVAEWFEAGGLRTWQDEAGNLCGSLPSEEPNAPTLLIGSHLDSVPDAGKYDGILGVLLPLAALRILQQKGERFPFNIDLIGFADEEGSRFGTTLLGSRAVAGTWNDAWFELRDENGVSLRQALVEFGCDPNGMASCSRADDDLLAYLEVHIEQGPVLESAAVPVGVVTAIAGARRFVLEIEGQAGHAGTVPMCLRKDALVAAAHVIQLVEVVARKHGVVATVGQIHCAPGAPNVVPGHCRLSLDIRSGDDALRDRALNEIQTETAILHTAGFSTRWTETHSANAVDCAPWIQDLFGEAIAELGYERLSLLSGAGHDAMSFKGICDIGMLFVRCEGGISHNPAEAITQDDVAVALETFCRTLQNLRKGFEERRGGTAAL